MSFEKKGKSSGIRRQARECALQMLFAADLAEPGIFTTNSFWGEMGFAQVYPKAETIVDGFVDRAEQFAQQALDLRPVARRTDLVEKNNSRVEKLKLIADAVGRAVAAFREYLRRVIDQKTADLTLVRDHLTDAANIGNRFINDFETTVERDRISLSRDDKTKYNEFKQQIAEEPQGLIDNLLPSVESMAAAIEPIRIFADKLATGTLKNLEIVDERIKTRAEHWRIERMAIVDRNVLRLAVYEFLYEDTPHTVIINEGLEIARRFSTFEATQFINGILDAIKLDLEKAANPGQTEIPAETELAAEAEAEPETKSHVSSS